MYEDIEDNGGSSRHSREDNDDEDIHLKTMECEDIVSFEFTFILS